MQAQITLQDLFKDYQSISKGLDKLKITTPTDFQLQLLEVEGELRNLIITAPEGSGKVLGLVLVAVRRFVNQEEGILVFLSHSKELSQQLHHLLSALIRLPVINLYMQEIGQIEGKAVIIGSPLQVNNLWKKEKDQIISIVIPEIDYLFGYGYGDALALLAGSINCNKIDFKLSCMSRTQEVEKFKEDWMKKTKRIDYQHEQPVQKEKAQEQITHFYASGDKVTLPISLYVTLKFGLVNPKILVIVQNLREVYRYALFLERCHLSGVSVYNHQNPVNLRFYVLSVWMNGTTNILFATRQILKDLNCNVFKSNAKKAFRGRNFQLINMTSIITIGLGFLKNDYDSLFKHFQMKPFLMTFIENSQAQIGQLQSLISYEQKNYQHVLTKQLPITKPELEGFRYRVNDVWSTLNNHKADLFQQLDFKKKLLKAPQLREELEGNPKQRQVLVKAINDLRKKIDHNKVCISDIIPEYLVPACLKSAYQQRMKALQAKFDEERPAAQQKIKKVLRHVNLDDQNPETTDVSRLKLISARKRWKLLHGFKLKKANKRRQQKGIFQSS